jgi:hypothetical protein
VAVKVIRSSEDSMMLRGEMDSSPTKAPVNTHMHTHTDTECSN